MNIGWELIKKDFLRFKQQLFLYGTAAVVAVAIMSLPYNAAAHFGGIAMVFIIIAFYCHLVMKLLIIERKEQNHLFLMTLPISAGRFMDIKVATLLLMFIAIWLPVLLLILSLAAVNSHWLAVIPTFHALSFSAYLPAFALTLLAATVTLSEGATIVAFSLSNLFVVFFLNFVPMSDFMQNAFTQGTIAEVGSVIWPSEGNLILLANITAFLTLTVACFFVARRKRSFTD